LIQKKDQRITVFDLFSLVSIFVAGGGLPACRSIGAGREPPLPGPEQNNSDFVELEKTTIYSNIKYL